jgi:hypothetical protein
LEGKKLSSISFFKNSMNYKKNETRKGKENLPKKEAQG